MNSFKNLIMIFLFFSSLPVLASQFTKLEALEGHYVGTHREDGGTHDCQVHIWSMMSDGKIYPSEKWMEIQIIPNTKMKDYNWAEISNGSSVARSGYSIDLRLGANRLQMQLDSHDRPSSAKITMYYDYVYGSSCENLHKL